MINGLFGALKHFWLASQLSRNILISTDELIDLWLISHWSLIGFWGFCLSKKERKQSASWWVSWDPEKWNCPVKAVTKPPLSSYITSCWETSSLVNCARLADYSAQSLQDRQTDRKRRERQVDRQVDVLEQEEWDRGSLIILLWSTSNTS